MISMDIHESDIFADTHFLSPDALRMTIVFSGILLLINSIKWIDLSQIISDLTPSENEVQFSCSFNVTAWSEFAIQNGCWDIPSSMHYCDLLLTIFRWQWLIWWDQMFRSSLTKWLRGTSCLLGTYLSVRWDWYQSHLYGHCTWVKSHWDLPQN